MKLTVFEDKTAVGYVFGEKGSITEAFFNPDDEVNGKKIQEFEVGEHEIVPLPKTA